MIEINNDIAISSDAHQWKLLKRVKPSKANPDGGWVPFKFYPSFSLLQSALRNYLLRTSEYKSFADLERNLREINKLLEKRFRTI